VLRVIAAVTCAHLFAHSCVRTGVLGTPEQLVAYTHYMPKHWRHRCSTYDVRDEFLALFRFRVELFLQVCC
jgi:hypothetical protein